MNRGTEEYMGFDYLPERDHLSIWVSPEEIYQFELGRQVHGIDLMSALRAFDMMEEKYVISWTAVISACSRKGMFTEGSILKAWSEEKALRSGRHVHSLVVKKMIKKDVFVGTSLMDMYAKCGEISDCRKVFDGVSNRNMLEKVFGEGAIANSEALLIGRSIHSIGEKNVKCLCGKQGMGFAGKELKLTYRMDAERFEVGDYIFATIISTCGDVDLHEAESSATPCYLETS
ncbi:hypothetical protein Bca101_086147 [Brassica carinata]